MVENYENIQDLPNYKLVDGRYFVKQKELGSGNFAITYISTLKENEQIVYAAKMVSKQAIIDRLKTASDQEARKEYIVNSLKNEVVLWKELTHDNIVKFIDFSETPNNIYLFLQYCANGTLQEKIRKKPKIPEKECIIIFKQISDGLQYLYKKGIYHRDIKPENILIHEDSYKIADFGFAKLIEEEKKDMAMKNTSVGTPFYMSPQVLNGQEYSIKCDVWSLGVMFYQCLFGILPWNEQKSIDKLLQQIQNEDIMFPPSIQIKKETKELIKGMLQQNENDRLNMEEVYASFCKL